MLITGGVDPETVEQWRLPKPERKTKTIHLPSLQVRTPYWCVVWNVTCAVFMNLIHEDKKKCNCNQFCNIQGRRSRLRSGGKPEAAWGKNGQWCKEGRASRTNNQQTPERLQGSVLGRHVGCLCHFARLCCQQGSLSWNLVCWKPLQCLHGQSSRYRPEGYVGRGCSAIEKLWERDGDETDFCLWSQTFLQETLFQSRIG